MQPHEINAENNFIMGWYPEDTAFCDVVLDYYNSKTPYRGFSSGGVNLEIKDSFDVVWGGDSDFTDFFINLQKCADAYINKYEYCNTQAAWAVLENVNIQKYLPQGGYHVWHCERTGSSSMTNTRHLVFMTYLNDVTDAGETEFFYQKAKIKPKKGLTLIWPADWMFIHRGVTSPTQEKTIITGWFNYTPPNL
jgi:hypothetical protein